MGRIYNKIIAANDTDADLKLAATAICDGTNDETEINAAIAAGVGVPYSILLLPGTYHIGAGIDFTPLTAAGAKWMEFEASGTTIQAAANMATMIKLDPGAGGQIVTCADIRLGVLDGNAPGGKTVTQIVHATRFSDNILRIADVKDSSGDGVRFSLGGVSDYPAGNNKIDIEIIRNCAGAAFRATGGTNAYGFQGNTVHIGNQIANGYGIVLGDTANQNAIYNMFITGPIEVITNDGITDYCGANTFIVNNLNGNGKHLAGPTGMTLRSTYLVHIDLGTAGTLADDAVLDQHYVLINGSEYGIHDLKMRAAAPAAPASGFLRLWGKTGDGHIWYTRSDNTSVDLG